MDAKGEFRFEKDGKSVQERLDQFEQKLGEYSTGVSNKITDSQKEKEEPK